MFEYAANIWHARYFCFHLAMADLRSRWRRSFFGILWSVAQPLGMTLLLAFFFSRLLHADITTYAPYILSGIVIWEFIAASLSGGALSFVQADAYIKQCRHPLAIYTLRTVISNLAVLACASIALFGWAALLRPVDWHWLAALCIFPVLVAVAWPLATLLAYFSVRFRDIPHAVTLIMQTLWFISPVYFEAKLFRQAGLDGLVDYNPIFHILQIVRAPLLDGAWPTAANFGFALGTAGCLALIAVLVGRRAERRVIFYL